MHFWLVLLAEHEGRHYYVPNAVYRCLVAGQLYPLADSLQQTIDAFKLPLPTLVSKFTQQSSSNSLNALRALTDRDFLIKIASSCEIIMILINVLLIFRSRQFPKVK